jgi:rhodanese-related sulfurtransferase
MVRELDPLAADDAARDGAILLDVREPEEFDAGHAPGAVPLPLGALAARAGELDLGVPVVCVCRSGHRSAHAAAALTSLGLDAVNLAGGMLAWAAEGLPVVTGTGGAGAVL